MTDTHPAPTCDICPKPAAAKKKGATGVFRACAEHQKHLDGWVRDDRHEARCEAKAAARFEEMAYGRDN